MKLISQQKTGNEYYDYNIYVFDSLKRKEDVLYALEKFIKKGVEFGDVKVSYPIDHADYNDGYYFKNINDLIDSFDYLNIENVSFIGISTRINGVLANTSIRPSDNSITISAQKKNIESIIEENIKKTK